MTFHPSNVHIPGYRGTSKRPEVIVSVHRTVEAIHTMTIPALLVVRMVHLEPGECSSEKSFFSEEILAHGQGEKAGSSYCKDTQRIFHCWLQMDGDNLVLYLA